MRRKIFLSILCIISLIPMLFPQYGAMEGVEEISGLINLLRPIGFTNIVLPIGLFAVLLYFIGIWGDFRNKNINKHFSYIGMLGVISSEIINLLTWDYPNKTFLDGVLHCFYYVLPMFYVGLFISIAWIIVYTIIDKKLEL